MFEDSEGNLYHPEEIDDLSPWELDELGIQVSDRDSYRTKI